MGEGESHVLLAPELDLHVGDAQHMPTWLSMLSEGKAGAEEVLATEITQRGSRRGTPSGEARSFGTMQFVRPVSCPPLPSNLPFKFALGKGKSAGA